ncbi:MAG: HPr family phosphocarrier protein [Spirochaetia bacterium]
MRPEQHPGNNPSSNILDESEFLALISERVKKLLLISRFGAKNSSSFQLLSRKYLGDLKIEATRTEETLDFYGAKSNDKWFSFREAVSAAKNFSDIAYILMHIQKTVPSYQLIEIKDKFPEAADDAVNIVHKTISNIARELISTSKKCGIDIDKGESFDMHFDDTQLSGKLEITRQKRHVDEPGKMVTHIATAFLNLAEESELLGIHNRLQQCDYAGCIPNLISEAALRKYEAQFHNLQALYDTHIANSDIEIQDRDLPIIRGHISIIFHLLEIATGLSHYYERHLRTYSKGLFAKIKSPISEKHILNLLVDFSLAFSDKFLEATQNLCRGMLKRYAEIGEVEVPVPNYRGFHVRPSTLVAKIVLHYGSEVQLIMGDEEYDASQPLELFRVNEKINAEKRRKLYEYINDLQIIKLGEKQSDLRKGLRRVFFQLLENQKIVNYCANFNFDELEPQRDESLPEFAKRSIAHFLALGQIDIRTDLTVKFRGDKRVLEDLKLLAENGYGEDDFGNNIVLPKELGYLRR